MDFTILEAFMVGHGSVVLTAKATASDVVFCLGPKDASMELVLEKTYDAKTGKACPTYRMIFRCIISVYIYVKSMEQTCGGYKKNQKQGSRELDCPHCLLLQKRKWEMGRYCCSRSCWSLPSPPSIRIALVPVRAASYTAVDNCEDLPLPLLGRHRPHNKEMEGTEASSKIETKMISTKRRLALIPIGSCSDSEACFLEEEES
ncbi:hypothetical protein F0562_034978 [Nyssa sinensis]|uniref:Uncharacterized protein n=1 Tax=Nyssa sinensis TaxID=561372 RepID=A0A5J5ADW5_9ASTE|nr:hypothetical protein F0562_034978 [Nyssa sinensis]